MFTTSGCFPPADMQNMLPENLLHSSSAESGVSDLHILSAVWQMLAVNLATGKDPPDPIAIRSFPLLRKSSTSAMSADCAASMVSGILATSSMNCRIVNSAKLHNKNVFIQALRMHINGWQKYGNIAHIGII